MNYFSSLLDSNSKFINETFDVELDLINRLFKNQTDLLNLVFWTFNKNLNYTNKESFSVILSGFIKGQQSIYGAYDLNTRGQYGSSRILLRHAYEYLLIAKYTSVSKNASLIASWKKGDSIFLGKDILYKLKSPTSVHFNRLWKLLCKFTHATVYSQQDEFKAEKNKVDIEVNFNLILAFLEMSYHLFNRHIITSSVRYNLKFYSQQGHMEKFLEIKREMRKCFIVSKAGSGIETKVLIRDYVSNWTVK